MSKERKTKKPFYKKWWFWAIVVVIGIAAANSGGGSDDKAGSKSSKEAKTENASATVKNDSSTKKEETKTENNKEYKIGDVVKVGDIQYTINSKTTAKQVGPSALPKTASGKFVILDVTVKNTGDKAATIDSSFIKLKRGNKTYEADAEATVSANQKDDGSIDNSFFGQDVNPDSEITGKVVFDVAEDAANAKDVKVQVQSGVFGTQTQIIKLQ